jgi:hypothetical protein
MRIATYNVEWFDHLFDDRGQLIDDHGWSGRQDIRRDAQTAALGAVFRALDADGVMVIEAPDSNRRRNGVTALETFASRFDLRARKAVVGFANDTQQEIIFLHDPDTLTVRHDPQESAAGDGGPEAPRFDASLKIDLDIDAKPETVRWSKPPLELAARTKTGTEFRLIGVHAKSKAPTGARTADHAMRLAIENRRKQLAQCIWLRRRIDSHVTAGERLIVLGDFNDGPGLDEYEELFGRSSVEIVLGEDGAVRLTEPHAEGALSRKLGAHPTTARFYIPPQKRYLSALLDYIMVSPEMLDLHPVWHIWHPFEDPACYDAPELRAALLTASDHFPVTIDFAG